MGRNAFMICLALTLALVPVMDRTSLAGKKDLAKAEKALEAAEKYLYGEGVRKSLNRAISYFKKAGQFLPEGKAAAHVGARISLGMSQALMERKKYKDAMEFLTGLAQDYANRNMRWKGKTYGRGPTVEWDNKLKKFREGILAGNDLDEVLEPLQKLAREAGASKMGTRQARVAEYLIGLIYQRKKKYKEAAECFTPLAREQVEFIKNNAAQVAKREAGRSRTPKDIPKTEAPPGELKGKYKKGVEKGLDWLARFQKESGEWSETALESLAGDDPLPPGRTKCYPAPLASALACMALMRGGTKLDESATGMALKKGLEWIVSKQGATGFIPAGCKGGHPNINHSLYTWVLAEAVLRLDDPEPWKKALEKGAQYLLDAQNPGFGWRYGIRPGDNDTEHTAQAAIALIRARCAGVEVPMESFDGAVNWLDRVTDEVSGRAGFMSRGDTGAMRSDARTFKSVDTSTALALTARILLGEDPNKGLLGRGFDTLWSRPPQWIPDRDIHLQYSRYYTLAYGLRPGADANYNLKRMADLLVANQEKKGPAEGSWPPIGALSSEGRIVGTARAILSIMNARGVNLPEPLQTEEEGK